jgi:GntR family transcriptional regulator
MSKAPPLYIKVANLMEENIRNGTLSHGERLPNERWLCEEYKISRTTLRKAIKVLIEQELVERRPNRGLYVTLSKFTSSPNRPFSIFQELQRNGIHPSSKILTFKRIKASMELANHMQCKLKENLIEIHRLRIADGVPFCIQILYMPERLFPQLNPWLITDRSLYDVMQTEYNVIVVKSHQVITTTLSSPYQSELLNISSRTPLLVSRSTKTSRNDDVVCYQTSYILTYVVQYSHKFKCG